MKPKVYYLAAPAPVVEPASRLPRALALRLRLLSFWCRVRLTGGEIVDSLRRFGRGEIDAASIVLEQRADLVLAPAPSPRHSPGRVIDFAAARVRLRP